MGNSQNDFPTELFGSGGQKEARGGECILVIYLISICQIVGPFQPEAPNGISPEGHFRAYGRVERSGGLAQFSIPRKEKIQ